MRCQVLSIESSGVYLKEDKVLLEMFFHHQPSLLIDSEKDLAFDSTTPYWWSRSSVICPGAYAHVGQDYFVPLGYQISLFLLL